MHVILTHGTYWYLRDVGRVVQCGQGASPYNTLANTGDATLSRSYYFYNKAKTIRFYWTEIFSFIPKYKYKINLQIGINKIRFSGK